MFKTKKIIKELVKQMAEYKNHIETCERDILDLKQAYLKLAQRVKTKGDK